MPQFREMDPLVTLAEQLGQDDGEPVVLVNQFNVPAEALAGFEAGWAKDAEIMKRQPGFIATQLHRGIAGSGAYLNVATWQSVGHFRAAFGNPEFRAQVATYPEGITVSPHLFRRLAVPGICVG